MDTWRALDDYFQTIFLLIYPVQRFQFHGSASLKNKTFSQYFKELQTELIEKLIPNLVKDSAGGFFADLVLENKQQYMFYLCCWAF